MSQLLRIEPPAPPELRADFALIQKLSAAHVFPEAVRLEALNGRLIAMPADGDLHQYIMYRLHQVMSDWKALLPPGLIWMSQPTLHFADGDVLLPDFVIGSAPEMDAPYPAAAIALVIEVAVTTYAYDRGPKRERYAREGVGEHWLIAPERGVIQVSRRPDQGEWTETFERRAGEALSPLSAPAARLDLADLLGPQA